MARRTARITHDEVMRMVKAVRDLGLPIGKVTYDGQRIEVVIDAVDCGENSGAPLAPAADDDGLLREPAE